MEPVATEPISSARIVYDKIKPGRNPQVGKGFDERIVSTRGCRLAEIEHEVEDKRLKYRGGFLSTKKGINSPVLLLYR